eukprot:GFUD01120189.1.p1 GENE.GFUD01120189.1~~GFUD01120189.1.p1  ORF type:complete len:119 (+),score=26.48 GFUD01120189.1:255-611(+)
MSCPGPWTPGISIWVDSVLLLGLFTNIKEQLDKSANRVTSDWGTGHDGNAGYDVPRCGYRCSHSLTLPHGCWGGRHPCLRGGLGRQEGAGGRLGASLGGGCDRDPYIPAGTEQPPAEI